MLTRKRPETIATTLTVIGQGETATIDVTYFNRKQSEVEAKLTENSDITETVLFTVKEWDCEYPLTNEGITELEDERPGVILAIIEGFHQARRMAKEKN